MEDAILTARRELREESALGEFGAAAIRDELRRRGIPDAPCTRTIGRILVRRGALDGRHRVRRPAPPRGWYLPDVAAGDVELESWDVVEGLVIKDGPTVEVLNGTSLHGSLIASWPVVSVNAKVTVEALVAHWREVGLPAYAQFDNDTRFQGPHQFPDAVGRVVRLCLGLGVVPVFAPPQETGFQASIENLNGRWQAKVWARFQHMSLDALQQRSHEFVKASRRRAAARMENAPERRAFPKHWRLNLQAPLCGRIIYLRRSDAHGRVSLLGHTFKVDTLWPHRLVRATVDMDSQRILFHALRRREPTEQPLLREVPYVPNQRPFQE